MRGWSSVLVQEKFVGGGVFRSPSGLLVDYAMQVVCEVAWNYSFPNAILVYPDLKECETNFTKTIVL